MKDVAISKRLGITPDVFKQYKRRRMTPQKASRHPYVAQLDRHQQLLSLGPLVQGTGPRDAALDEHPAR